MLETLLKKFNGYQKTCPISNLEEKCVTFIRDYRYIHYLIDAHEDVWVLAPKNMQNVLVNIPKNIKIYLVDDPDYVFTIYHNEIYKSDSYSNPIIGRNCKIHDTVIMDVEGLKVVTAPDGNKIQFRHTGNVIIEDNVEIGPYTVIHRGAMLSTIIKRGVKIGAKNNIAHNNIIGENTVVAAGVVTNGSVNIGKECWISSGALLRNGISICDNVLIGLGSVVIEDITNPGVYVGNPARFLRTYNRDEFVRATGAMRSK
jgi:acetyltransferase-like isoleucine patch superfamily enzyme